MFKNRLRTAALAGAVAVATGMTGMAVPAVAQTAIDGVNNQDGSAAAPVTAQNITEVQLRTKTDATAAYLAALQDPSNDLQALITEYIDLGSDGFDPSEEAARIAFEDAEADAAAQLATSAQNIKDARASVLYALEKDQAATEAWDALVSNLNGAVEVLNPPAPNAVTSENNLIERTNDANTHVDEFQTLPALTDLEGEYLHFGSPVTNNPVDRDTAHSAYEQLKELKAEVDRQYELAGIWNIDTDDGQYINREHMAALEALKIELDARFDSAKTVYDAAVAANREAQKTDVLVRQLFLERATAQRDTLRAVEAVLSTTARFVELHQDGTLYNDGDETVTLASLYSEAIDAAIEGVDYNLPLLADADQATVDYFLAWESDLTNNNDGDQYKVEKAEFAVTTYQNLRENSRIWQDEVKKVEAIDAQLKAQGEAAAAEAEALAAEKDRLAKEAEAAAALQKQIAEALQAIAEGKNNTPAPIENGSTGSSENTGIIGLIAAIGGIVGLIAVAFPFIQDFLR
ncbi:hypothetical protein COCCU_11965 [Corynebacterium occultum]|uniref:Uncharacterized protein n=1 Tax=Corynebacterium occultum TaxID=2675219 RepID=A0A6B8VVX5_9CORY|nr:S-layer protein PS2 [Corynebacterium occultum]QGU08293.1 hypothetical protein COCCU_11965 [Corynebacterium occultum]